MPKPELVALSLSVLLTYPKAIEPVITACANTPLVAATAANAFQMSIKFIKIE
jgi:hypothetical protein